MYKSNKGQLSIFMGITLIIVMGLLAFIINIGLFVKAKINLQNAADAAAFAGAATQARQLTNIAYANWELRNTYKEWMFKYYILGQLGLSHNNFNQNNGLVNFLLQNLDEAISDEYDQYNVPSICIHNNIGADICALYALPGLPRYPAIQISNISDIHEAFVDNLSRDKAKDCTRRSKLNMITAMTWAYGSGKNDIPEAPVIATDRVGAWPQALELAMRIRNLEMIANRPPSQNITIENVQQFENQASEIGLNERPLKAFWSAYRNLSGGAYKDCITSGKNKDCTPDEFAANLTITELSPKPFNANPNTVSSFLIPSNFNYPTGGTALEKHYLDLQVMPLNLSTMFSAFVTRETNKQGLVANAACGVSKTALPVPGYILGVNKNPNVLTYYAVKAESKFIGLFFPILSGESSKGIKLTAYAAAKPFGGRIGPKLFAFTEGDQALIGREDVDHRSNSYISGLEVPNKNTFKPGDPIPVTGNFWASKFNNTLGGIPASGQEIKFAIPNMIYDFQSENDLIEQSGASDLIQLIKIKTSKATSPKEKLGLYSSVQLNSLKKSIGNITSGKQLTKDDVLRAIIKARRPTKYDAINYLIPDFRTLGEGNQAAPFAQRMEALPVGGATAGYTYRLFAPLMGPNLLYTNKSNVESIVNEYIAAMDKSITTYLNGLQMAANSIYQLNHAKVDGQPNTDTSEAALSIHANANQAGTIGGSLNFLIDAPAGSPGCKNDLASIFNHFFRAKNTGCGVIPLKKLMTNLIEENSSTKNGINGSIYYTGLLYNEENNTELNLPPDQILTAYFPGQRQGTSTNGLFNNPLQLSNTETFSTKRNFYSTKFFHMAKIMETVSGEVTGTQGKLDYELNPPLRESLTNKPDDLLQGHTRIENPLKSDETSGLNNKFFLDF